MLPLQLRDGGAQAQVMLSILTEEQSESTSEPAEEIEKGQKVKEFTSDKGKQVIP